MNSKHPDKSHPFCNQLSHNIRPDGSCKFCESMECELDQPIWAVVNASNVIGSDLSYKQADILVQENAGNPGYHSLCIVSNMVASLMVKNVRITAEKLPEIRGRYLHLPKIE